MKIISIPIQLLEIEDGGYHLFIPGLINHKPVNLLLDTGASKTVFDFTRISELLEVDGDPAFELSPHKSTGLGTNSMESHLVVLESFSVGNLLLSNFEVVVLPMSHVNEAYRMLDYPEIDGVLGSDILKRFKANISYSKRLLKLYSK